MAKLIYAANVSLDGFTEDHEGGFAWAPPDDGVFVALTEVMRSARTYLYGRRMYETMSPWATDPSLAAISDLTAEFARVWQAAEKVVYSTTLAAPITASTRVERQFDPGAVAHVKATANGDLLVGGPNLAAQALAAGLLDEIVLVVWPIVLAGRNPALAADGRVDLELVDERRFDSGAMQVRYLVR